MPEQPMHALEPLQFPLVGTRLIEASAGTGKTYTIASLYVRLLLGLGIDSPLAVERILVVTFTEAATAELRDRIRRRVQETLQVLLSGQGDPLLREMAAQLAERQDWAIRHLRQCLRQMDEAEIHTIHGFCNRLLQRHAFESGSPFDLSFETQDAPFREEALRDFWRRQIQPLQQPDLELLARLKLQESQALEQALHGWLTREALVVQQAAQSPGFSETLTRVRSQLNKLAESWRQQGPALVQVLSEFQFNKGVYGALSLEELSDSLDADPHYSLIHFGHHLTPESLTDKLNKTSKGLKANQAADPSRLDGDFFRACRELQSLLDADLRNALLIDAWQAVRQRMAELKAQQNVLTPDDLLSRTAEALRSDNGELLAQQVRARFPMALIDEFQDTDGLQYFIFQRLFGEGVSPQQGFCMIGDPKQAIYGFRGGDIFTYVAAKRALLARQTSASPHLFTLDTNWRSASALVRAVNALFAQSADPFLSETIPFHAVKAGPKADQQPLLVDGQAPLPLAFWLSDEAVPTGSKDALQQHLAQATAYQVAHWLSLAQQGRALIGTEALQARDIAVLVRSQHEGRMVQEQLQQQGVRSVSISRVSIFAAAEAQDLFQLLRAAADPGNERLLRAALGCDLLGYSPQQLDALLHDEAQWEQVLWQFQEYHRLWLRLGVIPMLRQLFLDQHLYARLAQQPAWERRLTNVQHLAEMLQQASQQVRGVQGLLRWFQEALSEADDGSDEQLLRLESDENLVKIVTIHKSKGLEYPVVLLPFVWARRKADLALFHDEAAGDCLTLDLTAAPEHLALADREALAEDLRLLYVALTRARHACFVGLAPYAGKGSSGGLADSAMGHLLFGGQPPQPLDHGVLRTALKSMLKDAGDAAACVELPTPASYQEIAQEQPKYAASQFRGQITDDWRLSSFTALAKGGEIAASPLEGDLDQADEPVPAAAAMAPSILSFPKGARAGTLLHELFESIDFVSLKPLHPGRYASLQALVQDKLMLHGFDSEVWTPVLCDWLQQVLATPLQADLRLNQVAPQARLTELEFHLPVTYLNPAGLQQLLRDNDPSREGIAPALNFDNLQGQLKGFIDLVFEQGGRYYVLDYKSNFLGPKLSDYHEEAMLRAVREHQYDLQYLLYTLALHRLLRYRLGKAYRYERHIGGVFYLFFRGMRPDNAVPYGVFYRKPEAELIERLDELLQGAMLL